MVKSQCGFGRISGAHIGVQGGQDMPTSAMRPEHTRLQMLFMRQATAAKKKAFITISFADNPPLDALPRLGAAVGKWQLGDCFGQPMLRPRHPQLPTNLHLYRPILGETLFNLRKQFQKRPLRLRHAPAGLRKRGGVARRWCRPKGWIPGFGRLTGCGLSF